MNLKQFYTGRAIGFVVVMAIVICICVIWKPQPGPLPSIPLISNGYIVKDGKAYWVVLSPQRVETPIPSADAATFVPLENGWGKDAAQVYFNGYMTRPADASVPNVDIRTFTSIPETFYGKDKNNVYFPTFVYATDGSGTGTYVYQVFPDADGATFEIVEPLRYAKDKSHVWSIRQGEGGPERSEIQGANPAQCTTDNLTGCEALYDSAGSDQYAAAILACYHEESGSSARQLKPNNSIQHLKETSRIFINMPKDFYPKDILHSWTTVAGNATAGWFSNSGLPGEGLDATPGCWSTGVDFEGSGEVDLRVKSVVEGAPDYFVRFIVSPV